MLVFEVNLSHSPLRSLQISLYMIVFPLHGSKTKEKMSAMMTQIKFFWSQAICQSEKENAVWMYLVRKTHIVHFKFQIEFQVTALC